jgi:hypothetical protein
VRLRPLVVFLTLGCSSGGESPIEEDEAIIFFPSLGRLAEGKKDWIITIHGWVFEPEKDSKARSGLLLAFREALGLDGTDAEQATFRERAGAFLADNERGKAISIRIGEKVYPVGTSGPNGHFGGPFRIPDPEVMELLRARGRNGRVPFEAALGKNSKRSFAGEIHFLEETGLYVISDIDDTIKVSEVKDRKALLSNTFLREFRAVPGMAELYARWAEEGAAFHYVTASPWQLYEPLREFIEKSGFPRGTFDMKLFRWKDSTFFDLFASPEVEKAKVLAPFLESFSRKSFILVGDSGEKDPEIYGALLRQFPDRVQRVLIRDTTGEGSSSQRMKRAFEGLPAERWRVFTEPKELVETR